MGCEAVERQRVELLARGGDGALRLLASRGPVVALLVADERLQRIGDLTRLEALAEDFLDCSTAEQWLALLTPDADVA